MHTAAVRRLTKDEHLTAEFATTWPQYDLDRKTRALLSYAKKLTQEPSMMEDSDVEALREAGWDGRGYMKPRRSSRWSTSVVGWKPLRGCRWIGYQKERGFPKQLRVSQQCRLVSEGSRRV
jgi:hypothetical protein